MKQKIFFLMIWTLILFFGFPICAADLMGWELNENNTGLAGAGIDKNNLPIFVPPANQVEAGIIWRVPANTILTDRHVQFAGTICLSAGNIVFERCWFRPMNLLNGLQYIGYGDTPVSENVIRDCDIDGTNMETVNGVNQAAGSFAINTQNVRIIRCNIYGFGAGIGSGGENSILIEGTYIHGLVFAEWFAGSGTNHIDGITIRNYTGPGFIIRNNRIDSSIQPSTGALFLQATSAGYFIDNIFVSGNLFEGVSYNVCLNRNNGGYGTNLKLFNNRFNLIPGPLTWGYSAVVGGPGWGEWQNNHADDPLQPDHKGAVIAEVFPAVTDTLTAPDGLQITAVTHNQIDLSWADNSANELGFRIERSTSNNGPFSSINMTTDNVTSFSDTGLTENTRYYYRIASVNQNGMSAYTAIGDAFTFLDTSVPNVPIDFSGSVVSSTRINLSWTDASTNESGFRIERSLNEADFVEIAETGVNVSEYADTGLINNTNYYYRVRAYNDYGNSVFSNVYQVLTSNTKPVITPVSLTTRYQGEKIEFDVNVTDVNIPDNITLEGSQMPEGSTLTKTGARTWRFSWQTDFSDGNTTIRFTANDGIEDSDPVNVGITVNVVSTNLALRDHKDWN